MNAPMTPEERGYLAAEYALGVLDGEELRAALSLAATDSDFGLDVARWSGRLGPLLDEIAPVDPPASVFAAIERRLGEDDRAPDNVFQLRRRLNVWRGVGAGASALAASLALVLLNQPSPAPQPQPTAPAIAASAPMVAAMEAEGSGARLVATWNPDDNSLVVAAAAGVEPQTDRSLELWVIPADGTPRSLGLMPQDAPLHRRLDAPVSVHLGEGATIAVSVEPVGGSPTNAPTGAVIAAGKLQRT